MDSLGHVEGSCGCPEAGLKILWGLARLVYSACLASATIAGLEAVGVEDEEVEAGSAVAEVTPECWAARWHP